MAATTYLAHGVISVPGMTAELSGYSLQTRSTPVSRTSPAAGASRSTGECAPQQPRLSPTLEEERLEVVAVATIERWWPGVRNRKIFRLLKEAICGAEHSLTADLLRKLSPREAELLKDPAIQARVKFRFGGNTFPPHVLFKVFTSTTSRGGGGGVHYISGKKMIKPASGAAEDARRQMGNRKFYDQMLVDACCHQQLKITDEVDVTTMKEYMQYVANVDESPAYMGGKENTWRRLSMDELPRHSSLYNIVDFLTRAEQMPGGASLERLQGLSRPPTQAEQVQLIKAVSSMRLMSPRKPPTPSGREDRVPSRRTKQAQQRVERMRRAYGLAPDDTKQRDSGDRVSGSQTATSTHDPLDSVSLRMEEEEEDWEQAADELYQWTQELSFEDIT